MTENDKMKLFYICAFVGIFAIWTGGVVILETHQAEVDRGFITEISGIALLVLGQLVNLLRSQGNANIANDIKSTVQDLKQ